MASPRHENHFDELRLLAAWFVLFSHCYPLYGLKEADPFARTLGIDTLGGVGVAIFFVLSGYLVAQSWERSTSTIAFVGKRMRRIYPALVVCVTVCVFLLGPALTSLPLAEYFRHSQTWAYLKTASGLSIHFVLPGVFVDVPHPHAVNGSLWSLPYEIMCYVSLIAIAWIPGAPQWKALAVVAGLATILLLRPTVPPASAFATFGGLDYYMNKLGLFFAIGSAFALWNRFTSDNAWWFPVAIVPLAVVVVWANGPLQQLLYVALFSALVIGLGLAKSRWFRLPATMGDWSYGLYLWAFPVQQTLAIIAKDNPISFTSYVVLSSVIGMLFAAASWYLVERRWLTRAKQSRAKPYATMRG